MNSVTYAVRTFVNESIYLVCFFLDYYVVFGLRIC